MVKKILSSAFLGLLIAEGILVGCDKTASPVVPNSTAVLKLSLPAKVLKSKPRLSPRALAHLKSIGAKNTLPDSSQGTLEYCLTSDGETPIKGSINYNSGSDVGVIAIPLPRGGKWVVAAEWFYTGDGVIAEFAGADEVNVSGVTSFTLNMENFNNEGYSCYYPYLADAGYNFCSGYSYSDTFAFDSGSSTTGGPGDILTQYDSPSGSEYFVTGGSAPVSFAYLGNGDMVNFATVPADTIYYDTTLNAKAAVVGPTNEAMAGNDVYVVKGVVTASNGNNGKVWIQMDSPYYCTGGSSSGGSVGFWFVYNAEGLNYMKFDETTWGHNNCNENVSVP